MAISTGQRNMLDNQVKEQLRNYLAKLVNPIEIVASINDTEKSREMTALLDVYKRQS